MCPRLAPSSSPSKQACRDIPRAPLELPKRCRELTQRIQPPRITLLHTVLTEGVLTSRYRFALRRVPFVRSSSHSPRTRAIVTDPTEAPT
jgi:hypothetical protein